MNLKKLFGGVLLFTLIVGTALPNSVLAQTTGGSTFGGDEDGPLLGGDTGNGVLNEVIRVLTGGTQPGTGSANTDSGTTGLTNVGGGGLSGGNSNIGTQVVDSTLDTGADLAGGFLNTLATIGHAFEDNPIVNLIGDAVDTLLNAGEWIVNEAIGVGIGVSNEVFDPTTSGEAVMDPANSGGSSQTIPPTGAQTGTQVIGQYSYEIPAGGYVQETTNPETGETYTTIFDEDGRAVRTNDPWRLGGSGGASIPGASIGTVGNPFSDGTDKNDAPSSNEEDTSNPYLFEYDPSSTNNNPAGAGAMDN